MNKKLRATPFVKWAGGKSQLLSTIKSLLPTRINRYYEPFVGGGAVFFGLQDDGIIDADKSFLSDINSNLLATYTVIRDDVMALIARLELYKSQIDDNCSMLQDLLKSDMEHELIIEYKDYLIKQET